MRKFSTKVGTVLVIMLCMVVALCVTGVAFADDMSYVIQSDTNGGYIANDTPIALEKDTTIIMSFSADYVLNLGTGAFGFGVVNADYACDTLISEENAQYGFGIAFNEGTSIVGEGELLTKEMGKASTLVEGQLYRIVYDNFTGELLVERAPENTDSYSVIHRAVSAYSAPEGTNAYFGIFFESEANVVLMNLEYEIIKSEAGQKALDVMGSENITLSQSENLMKFSSEGEAYIANSTPISNPDKREVVINFSVSSVELSDDATIGFAIGTSVDGTRMYGGEKSANIAFSNTVGVNLLRDNLDDKEYHDSILNVSSVFYVGYKVKAVFNARYGTFKLLLKVSEDGVYKEVYSMSGLVLPYENVYYGLQFTGKADITFYGFSMYTPVDPLDQAMTVLDTVSGGASASAGTEIEEVGEYKKVKTVGTRISDNGSITNSPIGMVIPKDSEGFVMEKGEMLAFVIEDIQGYANPSGKTQIGISFNFTRSLNNTANWNFDQNFCFSGQYESSRFNYYFRPNDEVVGGSASLNQTMGDVSSIVDITKKGISVMAAYDPYAQIYYMYYKTAVEPDYSLVQQLNLTDLRWDLHGWDGPSKLKAFELGSTTIDKTMYAALRLTGDIELTYKDMYAIKIKTSDIGVNIDYESEASEGTECEAIGEVLHAGTSGYYGLINEPVVIPDGKALAIEYNVEGVNYTNGTYNIGFMMTKDQEIFSVGEPVLFPDAKSTVINNDESYSEGGAEIWSLIHYKGSNDLTPAAADTLRTIMSSAGNSIRVLIYNDGRAQIQYKSTDAYTWNAVRDEEILTFADEALYVAIRLQDTYKMDVTKLKFYFTDETASYEGDVVGFGSASVDATADALRFANVNIAYTDVEGGNIYLTGNDRLTGDAPVSGSLYADTQVTLVAELDEGYAFDGWYLNGKLLTHDMEVTVDVASDITYEAKYYTASYILVENGYSDVWGEVGVYKADGSYVGIAPVIENGYSLYGWELSKVEYDMDGNKTIVEHYTITNKEHDADEENLLSDEVIDKLVSIGSVVSKFSNDTVTYEKVNNNHVLTIGSFRIVDRVGYEDNLIFKVPSVKSDEENGIIRQIEVKGLYKRNDSVIYITMDSEFGPEWQEAFDKTFQAGMFCIGGFVLGSIILIIIKIILVKRKEAKRRRENEGVIADDEVTFGGSIHDIEAEKTAQDDTNSADKANK